MRHFSFKNKRVTVFGLGLNGGGVATTLFLAAQGAKEIIVTDIKKREELRESLDHLGHLKNVTYVLGQHRSEDFTHVDAVMINPGIAWTNEYVKLALKNGVMVDMDASVFFRLCPCPIIGVTGTKGKTTTAALIAEMVEASGKRVVRVGIGQTPVLDELAGIKPKSTVVFELSSWRLSSLARLGKSPHIAVVTAIFPDHLNYYKNMEAYVRDKAAIFAFQKSADYLVVNRDNEVSMTMVQDARAQTIMVSESDTASDVFVDRGDIRCAMNGSIKTVAALSEIALRGSHNVSNVLAAVGAALSCGVDIPTIRRVITAFSGVEHRLERVCEKNGVAYYNDSAATVPEAAISALHSFEEPIILIAGGSNKGLAFDALGQAILDRVKDAILFKGEATDMLRRYWRKNGTERDFPVVETMEEAVRLANAKARPGDTVLLSPGATSFGLFKNEFDRGERFREAVRVV
jgi:UDP-N-acetylmuramoylalanine--D-glutamate ligase